jgi:probable phosphoglycerate mutase
MPKPDLLNILVIRCGPTEWEQMGRLVGRADVPLAADPAGDAWALAAGLDGVELSVVFHAGDQASTATAERVAEATNAKAREVALLEELDLGLWDGLRRSELEEKHPKAFREWLENPWNVNVPGGESVTDATVRLMEAIGRSIEKLRNPDPAVGVILRPMAYCLVRGWLRGMPVGRWPDGPDAGSMDWFEVSPARMRQIGENAEVGR